MTRTRQTTRPCAWSSVVIAVAMLAGVPARATGEATVAAPPAAACGNGLLEAGETCEACAADCAPQACTAAGGRDSARIELYPPLGQKPTAATLRIGYRGTALQLPGSGTEPAVRARLEPLAPDTTLTPNDLGYALRVVAVSNRAFVAGPIFAVDFDRCSGAGGAPELTCVVEGCASSGTPIAGCTCGIAAP